MNPFKWRSRRGGVSLPADLVVAPSECDLDLDLRLWDGLPMTGWHWMRLGKIYHHLPDDAFNGELYT